jgi:hypothetical protein
MTTISFIARLPEPTAAGPEDMDMPCSSFRLDSALSVQPGQSKYHFIFTFVADADSAIRNFRPFSARLQAKSISCRIPTNDDCIHSSRYTVDPLGSESPVRSINLELMSEWFVWRATALT